MITLRSNQTEPIQKTVDFFRQKNPKPSLIVLPTAWGKSILTAFVAKNCDDNLIVLQPSKELLEQNYSKYIDLCGGFGTNAGIYSASFRRREISQITYATIGSIKNMGEALEDIPASYLRWMLENFSWDRRNEPLRKSVIIALNR